MSQWFGVSMLVVTGVFILAAWGWLWSGVSLRARRIAILRCYPFSSRAAIPQIQAVIWPLVPLAGLTWIVLGAVSARMIMGRDPIFESTIVAVLFGAIVVIAAWSFMGGALPDWMYPGWMATRFSRRHPQRSREELQRMLLDPRH